jgi:ribosomal protein S18 acetylase RimI-like enzyme
MQRSVASFALMAAGSHCWGWIDAWHTPAVTDASVRVGTDGGAGWRIRPAGPGDLAFLQEALTLAVNWCPAREQHSLERVLADPHAARYLDGWGRAGDTAIIAETIQGTPIGAAWYRFFDQATPGYGFIDATTPELSIGVLPAARRHGVGRALLGALLRVAEIAGLRAVSLSVEPQNPARGFYERYGFVCVGVNAGAWTMRHDLGTGRVGKG